MTFEEFKKRCEDYAELHAEGRVTRSDCIIMQAVHLACEANPEYMFGPMEVINKPYTFGMSTKRAVETLMRFYWKVAERSYQEGSI